MELVENGCPYSCWALVGGLDVINVMGGGIFVPEHYPLVVKYGEFYGMNGGNTWFRYPDREVDNKKTRILLLALFVEACK